MPILSAEDTYPIVGRYFCRHIARHGSVYSRADIQSVLTQAVDCMKEMLLSGRKVQLGDLGEFNIVANRRAQALLLRAVTNGETTVDISKEEDEEVA